MLVYAKCWLVPQAWLNSIKTVELLHSTPNSMNKFQQKPKLSCHNIFLIKFRTSFESIGGWRPLISVVLWGFRAFCKHQSTIKALSDAQHGSFHHSFIKAKHFFASRQSSVKTLITASKLQTLCKNSCWVTPMSASCVPYKIKAPG